MEDTNSIYELAQAMIGVVGYRVVVGCIARELALYRQST